MEAPQLVQYFPAYFLFNGLLSILLLLNIMWSYYICKVVYTAAIGTSDTIANDIRSDSEDSVLDNDTTAPGSADTSPKAKKTQ